MRRGPDSSARLNIIGKGISAKMLNFVFDKSGFNYGLLVYNVACGAPNASDYDRLWLGVYEESSQKD